MSSTTSQSAVYARIRRNPRFAELVSKRQGFATLLSVIVLTIFYGFFMVVAFTPNVIGQRLSEGSYLTVGIAAELFISPRTVDHHRANICAKLDLHGINALLKFAIAQQAKLK